MIGAICVDNLLGLFPPKINSSSLKTYVDLFSYIIRNSTEPKVPWDSWDGKWISEKYEFLGTIFIYFLLGAFLFHTSKVTQISNFQVIQHCCWLLFHSFGKVREVSFPADMFCICLVTRVVGGSLLLDVSGSNWCKWSATIWWPKIEFSVQLLSVDKKFVSSYILHAYVFFFFRLPICFSLIFTSGWRWGRGL